MKVYLVTVIAVLIFGADPTKDPAKWDLDKLQGTWVLVGGEVKGIALTEKEARAEKHSIVIEGDRLALIDGETRDTCTIRLDPTRKPAWMDLGYISQRRKPWQGVNHALYLLNGDQLTICASRKYNPNSEEERPAKFSSDREENKNLGGLILFIYKRQKS